MDIKEILKAISALQPTLKEPFSMYVSGYKYSEIAETLGGGIPLGTVKSRIFFARGSSSASYATCARLPALPPLPNHKEYHI